MFDFLRGILANTSPSHAVVDVGGVGYRLTIPTSNFGKLPDLGEEVTLYTSLIIRENAQTLFGFLTQSERELFEVLITVSGVGPKSGCALIGHLSLPELQDAISNANIPLICKAPGIGKKTAERMIVELRDKLSGIAHRIPALHAEGPTPASNILRDSVSALVNLGYNQMSAASAVQKASNDLGEDAELSDLITAALKNC